MVNSLLESIIGEVIDRRWLPVILGNFSFITTNIIVGVEEWFLLTKKEPLREQPLREQLAKNSLNEGMDEVKKNKDKLEKAAKNNDKNIPTQDNKELGELQEKY